ncbi:hypothetical protein [Halovivax limisalsi]|uniref:hypothetical protein n=1 Tax=Halovivax limisalsi TaxID=1453760 RepID=UPI001FFD9B4C|nr:hypothetical protein [Halovivax limisalsi]
MIPDVALLLVALAGGVGAGLLAHEGVHAVVLRATGTACSMTIAPRHDSTGRRLAIPLAAVHPRPTESTSPHSLRLAALAPLVLAVPPFALGSLGVAPTLEQPLLLGGIVGWLACAIPSPQDFAVAFYARRAIDSDIRSADPSPADATPPR